MKAFVFTFFLLYSCYTIAQNDNNWNKEPTIYLISFTDIFYVYDLNEPKGNYRQEFLFNHNRHNEFNLNLGLLTVAIEHTKYRGNLSLQIGTYANDNYAAENGVLKNVFEATVGISLNSGNTLWLDAGIMPSHLGFESALSIDNYTLTRSLAAESSPYFLSGAKLTYGPNDKWEVAALVANGWQRIQRVQGNSLPSFGTQIIYKANDKISLNWSTFIGTDDPDSLRRMRYFDNLYGEFKLSSGLRLIAGFDYGIQQKSKESSTHNFWYSPSLIAQFDLAENWQTAIRLEHYNDAKGIIIARNTLNGFQTTGLSLNLDYKAGQNIACRLECRWLNSKDKVFEKQNKFSNDNIIFGVSMAIKLKEKLSK